MVGELCMSALSSCLRSGPGLFLGPWGFMVTSLLEGAFIHCKRHFPLSLTNNLTSMSWKVQKSSMYGIFSQSPSCDWH